MAGPASRLFPPEASFSERFRWFRRRAGWSENQLAGELGVHRDSVRGWEAGRHLPSRRILEILMRALCLSPAEKDQFRIRHSAELNLKHLERGKRRWPGRDAEDEA